MLFFLWSVCFLQKPACIKKLRPRLSRFKCFVENASVIYNSFIYELMVKQLTDIQTRIPVYSYLSDITTNLTWYGWYDKNDIFKYIYQTSWKCNSLMNYLQSRGPKSC